MNTIWARLPAHQLLEGGGFGSHRRRANDAGPTPEVAWLE